MYLKCFGNQLKTVYLQGPHSSRPCISRPCCTIYRKVPSSRMSWLVAHFHIFRLFMKEKFDAYVLWPLDQKVQNWIVERSTARNFTVCNLSQYFMKSLTKTTTNISNLQKRALICVTLKNEFHLIVHFLSVWQWSGVVFSYLNNYSNQGPGARSFNHIPIQLWA